MITGANKKYRNGCLKIGCLILFLFILFCAMFYGIYSCTMYIGDKRIRAAQLKYYSDQKNFVETTGVVKQIVISEKAKEIAMEIVNLSSDSEKFLIYFFTIRDTNFELLIKRGFKELVKIGDTIRISAAPGTSYNGCTMPIVALSTDEKVLLTFEEGYLNFIKDFSVSTSIY